MWDLTDCGMKTGIGKPNLNTGWNILRYAEEKNTNVLFPHNDFLTEEQLSLLSV